MNLTQPSYPLPPPPPPSVTSTKRTFHGLGTHFFSGIRVSLTSLEQSVQVFFGNGLKKGVIIALVLAATLSFALSFIVQLATGITATSWVLLAVIAPISEEIFKGLSIFIVAIFIWKTIPSRRHGALLGAAAGFGLLKESQVIG